MVQVVETFHLEDKGDFMWQGQCRSCWLVVDVRIQAICSHGIDLIIPKYWGF